MVTILGWDRRRRYEQLFDGLEGFWQFRTIGNAWEALNAVKSVSIDFESLRPPNTSTVCFDVAAKRGRLALPWPSLQVWRSNTFGPGKASYNSANPVAILHTRPRRISKEIFGRFQARG
jgi:hypothetical protein